MFYFPFHIWDVILPIDELIFFKMVIAPPTRFIIDPKWGINMVSWASPRDVCRNCSCRCWITVVEVWDVHVLQYAANSHCAQMFLIFKRLKMPNQRLWNDQWPTHEDRKSQPAQDTSIGPEFWTWQRPQLQDVRHLTFPTVSHVSSRMEWCQTQLGVKFLCCPLGHYGTVTVPGFVARWYLRIASLTLTPSTVVAPACSR